MPIILRVLVATCQKHLLNLLINTHNMTLCCSSARLTFRVCMARLNNSGFHYIKRDQAEFSYYFTYPSLFATNVEREREQMTRTHSIAHRTTELLCFHRFENKIKKEFHNQGNGVDGNGFLHIGCLKATKWSNPLRRDTIGALHTKLHATQGENNGECWSDLNSG